MNCLWAAGPEPGKKKKSRLLSRFCSANSSVSGRLGQPWTTAGNPLAGCANHPVGRNARSVLSAGGFGKSGAFLWVFSPGYCRMREEHSWLIVPGGLRIRPFTRNGGSGTGTCRPPLEVFPGAPTCKADVAHTRRRGSCLGGRCPPAFWADPSSWRKEDAVVPDHRVAVGGRRGGCGQHGGPFSTTQGAPIIISFCKASFKLLRYSMS